MPDNVRIGISSDYSGGGVTQAMADIQKLDQHLKSYAGATAEIAGLNRNFQNSQQAVNTAVAGGTSSITSAIGAYKTAIGVIGGITAGVMTFKKAYDFSREGAQAIRLKNSFEDVADSYNVSSQSILRSMKNASRGTIADTDMMLAANRAMLLGVSTNADELGKITAVAIARGRAMGLSSAEAIDRVYTGIGRLSPKILDDLGIITDANRRYKEYADAHGIAAEAIDDFTKREIIKNAVIADGQALLQNGVLPADEASSYERISASASNYWTQQKISLANMFEGGNNWLSGMLDSATERSKAAQAYKTYLQENPQAGMIADANNPYGGVNKYTTKDMTDFNFMRDALVFYRKQIAAETRASVMAQAGRGTNRAGGAITTGPAVGEEVLAAGLDIAKITEQYKEKTAELNEKLAEENDKLAELTKRYGEASAKVTEQKEKIEDVRGAITDLGKDFENNTEKIASGILKAKDASTQQQLDYARASGQISNDAYNQAVALDKLSEAYIDGKISANTYASGVANVSNMVKGMDGMHAAATIDIYIVTHRIGKGGIDFTGAIGASSFDRLTQRIGGEQLWTGGMIDPSKFTVVGDMPGGKLAPYSEAIYNGYVFDAESTRQLAEAGMLEGAVSRAFAGDVFTSNSGGGGSAGGGGRTQPSRRGGSTGGRSASSGVTQYQRKKSSTTLLTTPAASGEEDEAGNVAEIAAEVATAQMTAVTQIAVAQQEKSTESIVNTSQAQITATQQSGDNIVVKLDEVLRAIKKLPNSDDAYHNARAAQQLNV